MSTNEKANNARDKFLLINEILDLEISDEEKVERILNIITLSEWRTIYNRMNVFYFRYDSIQRRVGSNYEYFESNGLFKKYKETYRCGLREMKYRLDALKEINEVIFSDVSDEEKLFTVLKYYSKYDEFKRKYTLFIKFGENDSRIEQWRDVLNNFDNIDSKVLELFNNNFVLKNAMYRRAVVNILDNNLYLENYLYAEWVIKTYIDYGKNYSKNEFLNMLNMTMEDFDYCVKAINFLNPVLYNQYKEALSKSNDRRMFNLDKTYLNLENGINTGYLFDGTVFNILEFYKRIPFKSEGANFMNKTTDYLYRTYGYSGSTTQTILSYLQQNNIRTITYVSKEVILKTKMIVKGIEITESMVNDVFDYMKAYNLPKIMGVYRVILSKYLNNEIDMNVVRNKLASKSSVVKKTSSNSLHNPYTLVKKMV